MGQPPQESSIGDEGRPIVADLQDSHYVTIARANWLATPGPSRVRPEVIKRDLWDSLEGEKFSTRSLLVLESLQIFERYGPQHGHDAAAKLNVDSCGLGTRKTRSMFMCF